VGQYARTDIFGSLKNPSGFNLYQRINNNLVIVGQAAIVSPGNPASVLTVTIVSLVATVAGQLLPLTLSAAVPAATSVKVFATAPQSAGITFVKSEFRLITTLAAATATPVALGTFYTTKFGAFVAGQKIFLKLEFINNVTGQNSTPAQVFAIAA
jgi:hypothetical protein